MACRALLEQVQRYQESKVPHVGQRSEKTSLVELRRKPCVGDRVESEEELRRNSEQVGLQRAVSQLLEDEREVRLRRRVRDENNDCRQR